MKRLEDGIVVEVTRLGKKFDLTHGVDTSRKIEANLQNTDLTGVIKHKGNETIIMGPDDVLKLYNGQYLAVPPIDRKDEPLELHVCWKNAKHGGTGRWHADEYRTLSGIEIKPGMNSRITSFGLLHGNVKITAREVAHSTNKK